MTAKMKRRAFITLLGGAACVAARGARAGGTDPAGWGAERRPSTMNPDPAAVASRRNPITGIADCCARAASGHAAAPPSSVMNARRLMAPP